jgi:hypothetical protein
MPTVNIPITGGFYESNSLPVSAQECNNWYVNPVVTQGLAQEVLFGTPGLTQLVTSGTDAKEFNRGSHVKNEIPYFVNGTTLYRLNRTLDSLNQEVFDIEALGTVEGSRDVSMSDNGNQLVILNPGGAAYIFDEDADTPFQTITDVDFRANGNPQYVVFLDGYFIFSTDEKKFIVSALNDGLSYNALDFGTAEADPDQITRPVVLQNQLFIIGSLTTEVFRNIGGSGFPFQRVQGYIFDKGSVAPASVTNSDNSFFMLGGGVNEASSVWLFSGNGYQKITTPAIDTLINAATDSERANSFGWSYSEGGSTFLAINIGQVTLVYDLASRKWHQRSSVIDEETFRFRGNSLVTAYGRVLIGDSQDGRVGVLDRDTYDEYGESIRRVASSPTFSAGLVNTKVAMVEATVESGVGNAASTDPQMSMDYSDDGGKTFVYPRTRSMGKIGEYKRRVVWRRNGAFPRFRILRFTMSDAVKPVLISISAQVSV